MACVFCDRGPFCCGTDGDVEYWGGRSATASEYGGGGGGRTDRAVLRI